PNLNKQLFLFSPNRIDFIFKSCDPHDQIESLLNKNGDLRGDKVYNANDGDSSPSKDNRNSSTVKSTSPISSKSQRFDIQQQQYKRKPITKFNNMIIYNGRRQIRGTSSSAEQESLPIQQNIQPISSVRQWNRRTLVTI
ncbi:unnamed protein product, partial [Didymodactylos carnosus]